MSLIALLFRLWVFATVENKTSTQAVTLQYFMLQTCKKRNKVFIILLMCKLKKIFTVLTTCTFHFFFHFTLKTQTLLSLRSTWRYHRIKKNHSSTPTLRCSLIKYSTYVVTAFGLIRRHVTGWWTGSAITATINSSWTRVRATVDTISMHEASPCTMPELNSGWLFLDQALLCLQRSSSWRPSCVSHDHPSLRETGFGTAQTEGSGGKSRSPSGWRFSSEPWQNTPHSASADSGWWCDWCWNLGLPAETC